MFAILLHAYMNAKSVHAYVAMLLWILHMYTSTSVKLFEHYTFKLH